MPRNSFSQITLACALAGVASGLAIGTLWGARAAREGLRVVDEIRPRLPIDPLRGLKRAEAVGHAEQARVLLAEGRPWAAWNRLEPFVRDPAEADAAVVLMAARAAAAWTGWREVRALLRERPWLAAEANGEGLYLLGRGEEGGEAWGRAAAAYARYVRVPDAARRGEAYARLGNMLVRAEQPRGAAEAYRRAAEQGGPAADWFRALAAEAAAAAGDGSALQVGPVTGPAARVRAARAAAGYWSDRGEPMRAAALLASEAALVGGADPGAAALLELARGRLLVERDAAAARTALTRAAATVGAAPEVRAQAAALLERVPEAGWETELARAAAYEAARKPGLAARSLRAALRLGSPDTPEERFRLGRLLWEAVDLPPAHAALTDAAARLTDPERRAAAELLSARALARMGKRDDAIRALKRLPEAYPGTAAAGDAWFFLGDLSTTLELGIANYRRAAAEPRAPFAAEALWRLGDRLRRGGDPAAAAAAWERLAAELPRGDSSARAGYEAGRIHERAGRAAAAAAAYRSAVAADPLSYYAVRAADRIGADPLAGPLARPIEWNGAPEALVTAQRGLERLDALADAALESPWREELAALQRALAGRPAALLALAEGLRDRGHTIEAIRIGRGLLEHTGGRWDERLLRVVFPLPYGDLLRREADRSGVDAHLLAGLIRQESSWNPRARSPVGATGLAQVMPATGAWLASSAGVREFRPHLLTVPEVALRMGAGYLGDQMRRYRGRRDVALAAYNAGPGRADRWRRELDSDDVDAFREAIPFRETREYVKLVIRNAEVYRRLYGARGATGLVRDR